MRPLLILVFAFLFTLSGSCQDSVSVQKKVKTIKPIITLDSRNAFAFGNRSKMAGFRLGVEFRGKHRFGTGIYGMVDAIVLENVDEYNHQAWVDFNYLCQFYEYVFFQNRKWEFTTPSFIGLGSADVQFNDENGNPVLDAYGNDISIRENIPVRLIGASIFGQYKIFRWVGFGVGMGFRRVVADNQEVGKAFNSPLYVFKLKVFVGEFFKKRPKPE